ncbi:hypothetical protein [Roseospira visakhapatnamensis]|uniref:Uncharacterized protein n=1 Tax=Roseospira visakhapatnamensis TaxID=390880 RepID=A0A7W6RDH2_9PROT|nr:hypothetical protein [Roseospira visakhapatnamensis]MBB4266561.1 hypothetical protein [Roseospira visakhapatnamensis]
MDWSRFDRERFRKIMAVALRADGAEALTALDRARAHLDGAGGSIDDVLGGTVSVQMHGAREGDKGRGPNGHDRSSSRRDLHGGRQGGDRPADDDDPLRHALYASHIVTQLRTENRRLNDLLDQATRYIAELESEMTRVQATQAPPPDGHDDG